MRIPRDLSGSDLVRALAAFGYVVTRQSGSHIRLTTSQGGQHHVTVPRHDALRMGTLSGILAPLRLETVALAPRLRDAAT
jgi:predicted RNA binding protein YcfA (HicA-like mRNA interferase family)